MTIIVMHLTTNIMYYHNRIDEIYPKKIVCII